VDLVGMIILLGVAIELGKNPSHLRGQGSPVKLIYWGYSSEALASAARIVDPK